MAVEEKRGCGYRVVGGLYLVGIGGAKAPCDRLPVAIVACPTCGEEARFHRSMAKIDPWKVLDGRHVEDRIEGCKDSADDVVCYPPRNGFLMWVGEDYTPESFIREAEAVGISKRIPAIPTELTLGQDWVYLAYKKLIPAADKGWILPLDELGNRRGFKPGIFYAFMPTAFEYIVTEAQAKDEEFVKGLRDKGITPVEVPDDDPDHHPRKRQKAEVAA